MPATAQTLQYADLVTADVAVDNQVNFVDYDNYGHRVQVSLPAVDANAALGWTREAGTARPVGRFLLDNSSTFTSALASALSTGYTDIDAVTGKLSFDSVVFDTNTDSRIRESGISANDLVMAYVLCKVYGSSAVTTQEKIFNLEDAHGMLTSEFLAGRINTSFTAAEALSSNTTNEKGAIDAMFRDLLASDPHRFFDSDGKQIPGLFETNADSLSSGSWNLISGDVIEMRVEFTFQNQITLRTTRDVSQALNDALGNPLDANKETIIIDAGDKFNIRLQLSITDGSGGGGGGGGGGPTEAEVGVAVTAALEATTEAVTTLATLATAAATTATTVATLATTATAASLASVADVSAAVAAESDASTTISSVSQTLEEATAAVNVATVAVNEASAAYEAFTGASAAPPPA